jgi:hypothetical protein
METSTAKNDLKEVRTNMRTLYPLIRDKQVNINRAQTMINCSNTMIRAVIAECIVSKEELKMIE